MVQAGTSGDPIGALRGPSRREILRLLGSGGRGPELGLRDSDDGYDLLGYSPGGRVVLRMLVRGARPARAVVAGQGRDATSAASDRTIRRKRLLTAMVDGTPLEPGERVLADWMTQRGVDQGRCCRSWTASSRRRRRHWPGSSSPTLVVVGERDPRAGADTLAAAVPGARFTRVPGDHGALTRPQLLTTILAFLDGPGQGCRAAVILGPDRPPDAENPGLRNGNRDFRNCVASTFANG